MVKPVSNTVICLLWCDILEVIFNVTSALSKASEDLLKQHYIDLKDRPFYPGLVKYMNSGPVVAMVSGLILLQGYFLEHICLAP